MARLLFFRREEELKEFKDFENYDGFIVPRLPESLLVSDKDADDLGLNQDKPALRPHPEWLPSCQTDGRCAGPDCPLVNLDYNPGKDCAHISTVFFTLFSLDCVKLHFFKRLDGASFVSSFHLFTDYVLAQTGDLNLPLGKVCLAPKCCLGARKPETKLADLKSVEGLRECILSKGSSPEAVKGLIGDGGQYVVHYSVTFISGFNGRHPPLYEHHLYLPSELDPCFVATIRELGYSSSLPGVKA